MKLNKQILLLGSVLIAGIMFASCSNASGSSDSENTTPAAVAADEDNGISTLSIPSLVSREVYYNAYCEPQTTVETERWYYDSTNALTNYTVTTFRNIGEDGEYQEEIFVFSGDPKFSDSGTGSQNMYETASFVSEYNPENNELYTGKYIYCYDKYGYCVQGAYIDKTAESGVTGGCFKAVYDTDSSGYLMFKEASAGTISQDSVSKKYTITPDDDKVSEFRLCSYNPATQAYDKEAFYNKVPEGWNLADNEINNYRVSGFINNSIGATPNANLIVLYSCKYDDIDTKSPVLETKWEKRSFSEAPEGSSGNYSESSSEEAGTVVANPDASDVNISKIVYEFDTVRIIKGSEDYQISLQKSYLYEGSAAIPDAETVKTDGTDYSADGELSVISRQFDGYGRKTRETETSYGNKVKTVVWYYDGGSTQESGLAAETTYNSDDLLVSRSNYNLLETYEQDAAHHTAGDTEKYETLNYEYSTTRSYAGYISVRGLRMKRPRTIHWCER